MSILSSVAIPKNFHIIIELVYFLLITGVCLATFLRTREIEQLSSHKGIMLFRNIFLFFSIAYLVRFIHMLFVFVLGQNGLRADPLLHRALLFPVSFLSTIALLYLLATILIEHLRAYDYSKGKIFWFFSIVSFVLVIPTLIFRTQTFLIIIQLVLILSAGMHLLFCKRKNKSKSKKSTGFFNVKLLFILISFFWVMNLVIMVKSQYTFDFRLIAYGASILIFSWIYYRVHKRLSSK